MVDQSVGNQPLSQLTHTGAVAGVFVHHMSSPADCEQQQEQHQQQVVVNVRIEEISRNDDGEMARKPWRTPYDDVIVQNGDCSVRSVNLNGLVFFACLLVTLSWALDELWDAFHAQDASDTIIGSILFARGNSAHLAFFARCLLGVCVLFVVGIWSTSAYIKFRYLTPHGKDRPCPQW